MIKNKKGKPVLWLFGGIILTVLLLLIFPIIIYINQTEHLIDSELGSGEIIRKYANQKTKSFLQHHQYKKVSSITEFQGSTQTNGYLVAGLDKNYCLGIFVSYKSLGPYVFVDQVDSVSVNSAK
jgi:hypothetical protein